MNSQPEIQTDPQHYFWPQYSVFRLNKTVSEKWNPLYMDKELTTFVVQERVVLRRVLDIDHILNLHELQWTFLDLKINDYVFGQ